MILWSHQYNSFDSSRSMQDVWKLDLFLDARVRFLFSLFICREVPVSSSAGAPRSRG